MNDEPNQAESVPDSLSIAEFVHEVSQPLTAISNFAEAGPKMAENRHCDINGLVTLFRQIAEQVERAREICESTKARS